MKYLFSPSKMVCMPPSPPLWATSRALRVRHSMHNRRVPSFFFTQRHCAAQGEFDGRIIPRSKSFFVSSRIIWRSSGEDVRCFSATDIHASFLRGNVSPPSIHTGTRFGSDGKRPVVMYSRRASISYHFSFGPSWLRMAYFTWISGGDSAVVAVGGGGLGGSGMRGSLADGDPSNKNWNRCAFLALSAIMCAIEVKFDTIAGLLPRLTSLYVTGVPGFHRITPRATPTSAVSLKTYATLCSIITTS